MLTTEWNLDDALAVMYEEGWEGGWEGGGEKKCLEIARNALAKGSSFEFVHDITGLDFEILESLATER
jgi:predicted transposase YdaD